MKTIGHSLEALERYFQGKDKQTAKPKLESVMPGGVREKRVNKNNTTYILRRRCRV